jgi:hypothetical protein
MKLVLAVRLVQGFASRARVTNGNGASFREKAPPRSGAARQ